jgi:hypothetical protein
MTLNCPNPWHLASRKLETDAENGRRQPAAFPPAKGVLGVKVVKVEAAGCQGARMAGWQLIPPHHLRCGISSSIR